MRHFLLFLAVGWALTGCAPSLVRSDGGRAASPTPAGPGRNIGSGFERPTPRPTPAEAAAQAEQSVPGAPPTSFVLVMVDENGLNPSDIPIQIRGVKSLDLRSDGNGKVVVEAPAGNYTFEIPAGCGPVIDVRAGQSGRFGIAEGKSAQAEVRVDWRHRYAPSGPVFPSVGPYWPPGREVRVRYDVVDVCDEDNRAPNASLASRRLDKSPNVEIVSTGDFKADPDGYAYVTIKCTSAGPTKIDLVDAKDPRVTLDLTSGNGSSGNECGEFRE